MTADYYRLNKDKVAELFERARADYDVVAKTHDANGNLRYGRPASFDDVAFVDEQPPMSAKAVALPQTEALVRYARENDKIRAEGPAPPTRDILLFGVNMCDAAALDIIDHVFTWDYLDDPYLARRSRATQFALACAAVQRDCFCNRISYAEDGVDAIAHDLEGTILVKVQTEKGRKLVGRYRDLFDVEDGDAESLIKTFQEKAGTAKKEPALEKAKPALEKAFEHADWEILASTCVGCGICTYACPTCHCFDIQDEGGSSRGRRLRVWDHCTGRTFTAMAAEQPRDRQYKRYRQRLLHKFWYYPERFGPLLCTGCGRCIKHCPVKINIKELVEYFGGLKDTPPGGARHGK
jgi:ferredoxin